MNVDAVGDCPRISAFCSTSSMLTRSAFSSRIVLITAVDDARC